MKSAAAQPYEVASLMKSAFGLMKSGFALIVEFGNLPIAKQKFEISFANSRIRKFRN